MKTKQILFLSLILLFFLIPQASFAESNFNIDTTENGVVLSLGGDITGQDGAWGKLTREAQFAVSGISAIAVLICVASLIIGFSMMATANGNPNKLSTAKTAIMFGFIGIAGIGAVWVIAGLAFNLFN